MQCRFLIYVVITPVPSPHALFFPFLLNKGPFTKLNHFLYEQSPNIFYILLLLGMLF